MHRARHSSSKKRTLPLQLLPTDPYQSARLIGLRYVRSEGPGIVRRRAGKGFLYLRPDGKILKAQAELHRIRSLVIPPAWKDVWICPFSSGHLQAVGRDARGRKQYRYHPLYRQIREHTKFERLVPFTNLLPKIRRQVQRDLKLPGCPKPKILAAIVRLLEVSCIRIGNEDYARENDSFGLTTLLNKHVRVKGDKIEFHFRGKSGQLHDIELNDRQVAKIVNTCQSIPGQDLFQCVDGDGPPSKITSGDVNDYLQKTTGEYFTAKDFRTWAGTMEAARQLDALGSPKSQTEAKRNYVAVVKQVARKLGNRPATTKKYYVHPAIYQSYMDGSLFDVMASRTQGTSRQAMRAEELAVVALILIHQELGKVPKGLRKSVAEKSPHHAKTAA